MEIKERVKIEYFEWICDIVCGNNFTKPFMYKRLLAFLHDIEFTYFVPYDENRAADGIALRYQYCLEHDCEDLEWCLTGPCSVLEMMVALAIRCENIIDDPDVGDRTGQWFWGMITNMGIGAMHDVNYDEALVSDVVARFLDRDYEPDGRGGLFRVKNWHRDMRTAEIWHQLMAYINTLGLT